MGVEVRCNWGCILLVHLKQIAGAERVTVSELRDPWEALLDMLSLMNEFKNYLFCARFKILPRACTSRACPTTNEGFLCPLVVHGMHYKSAFH